MINDQRKIVTIVLGLIIISAVSYILYQNIFATANGNNSIGIKKNNIALNIEVPGIETGSIRLAEMKGEIVILDFMAPWCPPCKDQIKVLKLVNEVPNVNIVTINIDYRYSMEELLDFQENEGITWFFGHSPEAGSKYETSTIPTIIFIDTEGVIRYRGTYTTWSEFDSLLDEYGVS
jgi:thiol-disulfide isomerase/thioredoxin